MVERVEGFIYDYEHKYDSKEKKTLIDMSPYGIQSSIEKKVIKELKQLLEKSKGE